VIGTILRPASYMDYMDIEVTAGTWSSDANSGPRRSCSPESTWSNVFGRTIAYPGDDTAEFEQGLRQFMPSWMASDMRLMADFLTDGMLPKAGDRERLTTALGLPLRFYRDYASQIAG
jgi:hypothetical protein